MNSARAKSSPRVYARTIGLLYLIVIVLGAFAYGYAPGKLVSHNAVATAHNILSHQLMWRLGILCLGLLIAGVDVQQTHSHGIAA